eukprot:Hpha_TRINITY_DN13380_c0_g1::TRINITY_DN13380_c0_g1_i1::g.95592::m.95592
MAHALCAMALMRSLVATPAPTWSPTTRRDKEVGLNFGNYTEGAKEQTCPYPPINLQFTSDKCVFLDKDWQIWSSTGFALPVSMLLKFDCSKAGSATYQLYVDCEGASGAISLVCMFGSVQACGRKVIDATSYLEFSSDAIDGVCQPQCVVIPDALGADLAGKYCMNMRVDHCVDMTPAPDTPPPAPKPDWPDPPTGLYQATVKLGLEDGETCSDDKMFNTPSFHNGDCIDLVNSSGVELPSSLSEFGMTLAVRFTCHPTARTVEYSTHTSADCKGDAYSDMLPSGWANFGECIKTELVVSPSQVSSSVPDLGVAIRQPLYMEVDSCQPSTWAPTTPPPPPTGSPITTTSSPTGSTSSPTGSPLPAGHTSSPTASTTSPTASTGSPTGSTSSPTGSTSSPTGSPLSAGHTSSPTASTQGPTASTSSPTGSTSSPTGSTSSPTGSPLPPGHTSSPTAATASPTASTGSPTASTGSPTASTGTPTSSASPTAPNPAGPKPAAPCDGSGPCPNTKESKDDDNSGSTALLVIGILALVTGLGLVAYSYYPRKAARRQGKHEDQRQPLHGAQELGDPSMSQRRDDFDFIAE